MSSAAPLAHGPEHQVVWPQALRPLRSVPQSAVQTGSLADCFICRLRQAWTAGDAFRAAGPRLASGRKTVERGEFLFQAGDALRSIYSVHTGQFKTCMSSTDGRSQVTGFHVAGELLGLDAIGAGEHACDAVALEDAQVCVLSYSELLQMLSNSPAQQQEFWQTMSQQIVRDHQVMMWLGSLKAEERVASFLMNLLDRLHRLGFSSSALILRMSREEIGSYLGLTLETVSRAFSQFKRLGLLDVKDRDIRVLDRARMERMGCCS
jgi:CRP/FNR family transcriptional regulator